MTVKLTFLAQVKDYDDLKGLREQIGMCFEELGDVRLTGVFQVMDGSEPQKVERGAYGKVMLSDSSYDELIRRYGKDKTDALIDELSWKLYQKNYRYSDHFAVILEWEEAREKGAKDTRAASFDVDEFFKANLEREIWK